MISQGLGLVLWLFPLPGVSRVLPAGQGGSPVENGLQKVSTESVCRCVG